MIIRMQPSSSVPELEDLPNIGKRIASDLRTLGIRKPSDLALREPITVYKDLEGPMGKRHDPCVLYTLLAAEHYLFTSEALPWWKFKESGRLLLQENR